jgi:hypothetical protein
MAAIVGYWLPAYEAFSAEEDWGDPDANSPLYTARNDRAVSYARRWPMPDADHWHSPALGLCASGRFILFFCR